MLTKIC